MAIYHLSAKVVSRGKGQSSTGSAAYRAGEKIKDERTGITFDYTRKQGVDATEILAPDTAPQWVKNRSQLWNNVELYETRKNARVAREIEVALPKELNRQQQQTLVRKFVSQELINQALVVDIAYHHLNSHNPHAHILFTTRSINPQGFGQKLRHLDKKQFLLNLRQNWENHANQALEQAGYTERINHRSLEEQGSHYIPQIHLGANVATLMKRGITTERGDKYLRIKEANQQIKALENQIRQIDQEIVIEETRTEMSAFFSEKLRANQQPEKPIIAENRPSTASNQPTDAQLFQLLQTLQQWQKTKRRKPNRQKEEELKKQKEALYAQYQQQKRKITRKEQQLRELGNPRSLLNPFGVSEETISSKKAEISNAERTLSHIRHQINQVTTNLNTWQQEMKNYQKWLDSPQTKKMQELEEYLSSPVIMEQRQRIRQGYIIYESVNTIMTLRGYHQYIEGKTCRYEKQGSTLTITHKEKGTVLYQATDKREQGGILEIGQLQLSQEEIDNLKAYAQSLEQAKRREQQSSQNRGFSR